jgi:hypothetical protein
MMETEWRDVPLVTREALLREVPEVFSRMLAVGRPAVFDAVAHARATGVEPDPEIGLELECSSFFVVRLPLSFRPDDEATFRLVVVNIALESPGGRADCWSLSPVKVEVEMKVKSEAKLSAKLKLSHGELEGSSGSQADFIVYQPLITAFNQGTDHPAWEFRPTRGVTLRGIQVLYLTVRVPDDVDRCTARVSLVVDVVQRGILWNLGATNSHHEREMIRFDIKPPA